MTAIYWVGKHYYDVGNPDFIGFAHYRRCLDWRADLLKPGIVFASIFVSRATNRNFLSDCHGDKWLNLFLDFFSHEFRSDDYSDISDFWDSHAMYIANIFITDRETFMRYFYFVERCIGICKYLLVEHKTEFSIMSTSMKRQFSFIMERMTADWIWHEKKNRRITVINSRLRCYNINNNLTSVR